MKETSLFLFLFGFEFEGLIDIVPFSSTDRLFAKKTMTQVHASMVHGRFRNLKLVWS